MKDFTRSLVLTLLLIVLLGFIYPLVIWGIGRLMPEASQGLAIRKDGRIVGFENIGQNFTDDKYFNGRPSAVGYNAAATGGSNAGPTNPSYLETVKARIDTFLVHNPNVKASEIPSELVTASGGGLDPHISPQGARVQIARVASVRGLSEDNVRALVEKIIERPALGFLGMERVNVLKLNIALDDLK